MPEATLVEPKAVPPVESKSPENPKKPEAGQLFDTKEFTVDPETAATVAQLYPELARPLLQIAATKDGKVTSVSEKKAAEMIYRAKTPKEKMWGIDLQISILQMRANDLVKLHRDPRLSPEQKAQIFKQIQEIETQFDETLATRGNILNENPDLLQKNPELQSNSVAGFAKALGVEEDIASSNPLPAIREKLIAAITNKEGRQKLFEVLDQTDNPDKETIKKMITQKGVEKKAKNVGKVGAIGGIAALIMMLMMAKMAMKTDRKQ